MRGFSPPSFVRLTQRINLDGLALLDDLDAFLDHVVSTPEGWLQLLIGPIGPNRSFNNEWYKWPDARREIVDRIESIDDTNVYFSPHLFDGTKDERGNLLSTKDHVLPTRTLCVDLDNATVADLKLTPTMLVETSPGRHQGYWVLNETLKLDEFDVLSKQLTYTIPNADHSGWSLGHKFRLPGRPNFKYEPTPTTHLVTTLSSERIFTLDEMTEWVGNTKTSLTGTATDDEWINNPPTTSESGPRELLDKYRPTIGPKIFAYFAQTQTNRHEALWALIMALIRAKATRDEIFWICKHSANNKFEQDQHYNADRDLAKDIDRAFNAVNSRSTDLPELVHIAEKSPGGPNDRKRLVADIVTQDMIHKGEFVATDDGRYWYILANAGRPVQLGKNAELLNALLDTSYGLNSADGFQPFVTQHLLNFTISQGRRATSSVLTHLNGDSLLLHGGKSDVYHITANKVARIRDGEQGVLFPWRPIAEDPITIDDPIDEDWASWLFDNWFDNLIELSPVQAKLLIRVWVLFILFKDIAVSRPILALLGQPGSGKSSLFRVLYTLFYGRQKSLNALSNPEDFDYLVSTDPIVVFDNADSFNPWVPDRLALSAAASDLIKRKLYTDSDTVTIKRQAILGITAHDPKFGRADVIDRMIILNFQRIRDEERIGDSIIIERVQTARPKIWGGIVKDIQSVLATPDVPNKEIPAFRISDFARLGSRISKAIGKQDEFVEIINLLRRTQTAFSLAEDDVLIDVIRQWHVSRNGSTPEFVSVGYMHELFSAMNDSYRNSYKSAKMLANKLWTMQSNLKSVFVVDFQYDNIRGVRTWKIDPIDGKPKQPTNN